MTTYVIGPLHGGIQSLRYALQQLQFDKERDKLWFVGNVIGGDEGNFAVLNFIQQLGKQAVMVLGRNELAFMAMAAGVEVERPAESFNDLLQSDEAQKWLKWLSMKPLLHHQNGYTLVHAGIPADWSLSRSQTSAIEAESSLAMGNKKTFFECIADVKQTKWHPKLRGWKRTSFIVNALTKMTYFNDKGRYQFQIDPTVTEVEAGLLPWYLQADREMLGQNIITAYGLLPTIMSPTHILSLSLPGEDKVLKVMRLSEQGKHETFSFFREQQHSTQFVA